MQVPFNDLGREYRLLKVDLDRAVADVLSSGWYVHGSEHRAFEEELAAYLGVPHALGVGNGTDALELALRGVGAGPGREVVVAANAGGYGTAAARLVGVDVVYADVDPERLLLTPQALAGAVGPDTCAVIVTHLYGRVADIPALRSVLPDGVLLIEDCAQSAGATLDGARTGSLGDIGTFSFYPTKNLGAMGDGGAVVCRDPALAAELHALRQYGWHSRYEVVRPHGRNSRLDEIQAAVLRVKLPYLDEWNDRRRDVVRTYTASSSGSALTFPALHAGDVGHLAVARTPDRASCAQQLERAGVATAVHYPVSDDQQPGFGMATRAQPLYVTHQASQEVLSLPCFALLREDELRHVCEVLSRVR